MLFEYFAELGSGRSESCLDDLAEILFLLGVISKDELNDIYNGTAFIKRKVVDRYGL